jgi:hypothetical protein
MRFEVILILIYLVAYALAVIFGKRQATREKIEQLLQNKWILHADIFIWAGIVGLLVLPGLSKMWISFVFLSSLPALVRWTLGFRTKPDEAGGKGGLT